MRKTKTLLSVGCLAAAAFLSCKAIGQVPPGGGGSSGVYAYFQYLISRAGTLTLKGGATDGATAVGVVIDNSSALANASAKILSVREAGAERLYVDSSGHFLPAANMTQNLGGAGAFFGTGYINHAIAGGGGLQANSTLPLELRGAVANGAAAIGVQIGNTNALSNATSKIASFYNDDLSTEKLYISHSGKLNFSPNTDSTGTPGSVTNNAVTGRAAIPTTLSGITVTNSNCNTSSQVFITPYSSDGSLTSWSVSPGNGSFSVNGNANPSATWTFGFLIVN